MEKTFELKIPDDDTFCNHFVSVLLDHPNVNFATYRRNHFLENDKECLIKIIYKDNYISQILSDVKEIMKNEIKTIETDFEKMLEIANT